MARFFELALAGLDFSLAQFFRTRCLHCSAVATRAICPRCCVYPQIPESLQGEHPAALWFEEPWRSVWHRIKFEAHGELLRYFLPVVSACRVPANISIVPVPLHPSAFWKRGFNQSEWLAREMARASGARLLADGLIKRRHTAAQSTLSKSEREVNLKGCFEWVGKELPEEILLVDDVFTTGSTLAACTLAARKVGIKSVRTWTLFRVPAASMNSNIARATLRKEA